MDKDMEIITSVPEKSDHHEPNPHSRSSSGKYVFERYISPLAIIGFEITLQAGWEGCALTFQFAWLNGGPAAVVYGSVIAGVGSVVVAAALGEMASMDPTVGAQYRWSARFAGRGKRFWGFLQGWITVIAWICNCAATVSVASNTISGLLIFNYPSYTPQNWHATLLLVLLNLSMRRVLNTLEIVGSILHILFFIAIITTLSVLTKRSSTAFVFKTLYHENGWDNPGVAFSIGMLTTAFPISSFDGVLHMIDETKEPRKRAPRAMLWATSSNAVMQFGFCLCLLFHIGDVDAAGGSMLPITEVFYSATKSKTASTLMVLMMTVIVLISISNCFASVSRLVWAFARDGGIPFSGYFTYIHPTLQIPLPALILVCTSVCLLSLINLGSPMAFNALIALPLLAIYISYIIPITLLLLRQLSGRHPKYGPWRLGRWSVPIKLVSLVYLVYVAVFIPFPTTRPVTEKTMNYAAPVFLGAVLVALVDWFGNGRRRFRIEGVVGEGE